MIFYTDHFIPSRFAGYTVWFVILIRPEYRDDKGLLAHEQQHVKQFCRSFGILPLLSAVSKKWRLKMEVEAYRAQMDCYSEDKSNLFAEFLSTKYRLGITHDEAVNLLNERCGLI